MRQSAFALTEAKYAAGDFRHTVFDNVETVRSSNHFCNVLKPLEMIACSSKGQQSTCFIHLTSSESSRSFA